MAYTDMFDQYFSPMAEEERRRREQEARDRAAAEAVPVTQTVKTNPVTGQQEMTIKGSPHDLSAANPLTPTVTGPVVPNQAQPIVQPTIQQQPIAQPIEQPRPPIPQLHPDHQAAIDQVLPPAGVPNAPVQQMPVQAAPVQQMPVQAAPVQQMPVQAAPVVPTAPVVPVAPQQAPIQKSLTPNEQIVAPVNPAAPPPAMAPKAPFFSDARQQAQDMENGPAQGDQINRAYDVLGNAQADKLAIGKIAYGDYPPHMRSAAEAKLDELKRHQDGQTEGEKMMAGVQAGDPKAVRKFQKEISNPNEGSWGRLILAGLLGNKEAQTVEFAKLGIGSTTNSYLGEDNKEYMVTMNAKGVPISGINADGQLLNATELSNLSAGNTKTLRTQANHAANSVMERLQKENDEVAKNNRLYQLNNPMPHSAEKIQQAGNNAFKRTMSVGRGGAPMAPPGSEPGAMPSNMPTVAPKTNGNTTDRIFVREGGYVENDAGKGPTMYGINSESHPEVADKIRNKTLTPVEAKRILDSDINRVKGIDTLGPQARELVADAAINQGVGYANKLVEKFGNDAEAIATQRRQDYAALIESNPRKYKKYESSWNQRVDDSLSVSNEGEIPRAKSMAEKIAAYEMKPPQSRSKDYAPLMNEVARINPNYDETKYPTIQEARKKFTTGKQGDTVRSMNVAIDHLDTLKDAGEALNNKDLPLFNKIANDFSKNTGEKVVTDFNGIKSIVGSEVAKAVAGGQMALADREEIRKELDAANSPKQLNGVIKRFQELLAGQLKGLRTQYEEAGLKDFDKKLNPRTKRVLEGGGNSEPKTSRSNW